MKKFIALKLKKLFIILTVGVLVILSFYVFLIGWESSWRLKAVNMGKYYRSLDKESREHLSNNVFSLLTTTSDGRYITYSYGTCWSFYWDDDAWYLMTNYHVISKIVEMSSGIYPGESGETAFLKRTQLSFGQGSSSGRYVRAGIQLTTSGFGADPLHIKVKNAEIIYDRFCEAEYPYDPKNDQNQENLFAEIDKATQKRYQLDMALIRLPYDQIEISQTSDYLQNEENPKDWIQRHTYRIKKWDEFVPTQLSSDSGSETYYYICGYPLYVQPTFSDYIFRSSLLRKSSVPVVYNDKKEFPSSIINAWSFKYPFKKTSPYSADSSGWTLNGGASGSPLLELTLNPDGTYHLARKTPVAIFWGGYEYHDGRDFEPAFCLFRDESDVHVKDYNVLWNCYNRLSPKTQFAISA